jgi:MFS superfamily sulfate permease-like transporter
LTEGLVQWCNQRGERGENRIKDLEIGIVVGMLVSIYARIDYRGRISRVQRENKELKEEVVEEEKEEEAPVPFTAVDREKIDQSHTD